MLKISLLLLPLFFFTTIGYNQYHYWVKNVPGKSFVDSEGNTYKTGGFEGTFDFDPGEDVFNVTGQSDGDGVYVMKLDPNGNLLWAYPFTSEMWSSGTSIVVNSANEVFIWGSYKHSMDADPSDASYPMPNAGLRDCFLIKLKAGGEFEWAKNIGGWVNVFSIDIALDNDENLLLTGEFDHQIDCDPGPSHFGLPHLSGEENIDDFIIKLNSDGEFIGATNIGSSYSPKFESLCADVENQIFIGGSFEQDVNFDPWFGDDITHLIGEKNGFVLKYDDGVHLEWIKQIIGTSDISFSVVTETVSDGLGHLYVSGYFSDSAFFDSGEEPYGTNGLKDGFILKLNTIDGSTQWIKTIGGSGNDLAKSLSIDPEGNISIIGEFSGVVDFDFSESVFEMSSNGISDIFILNITPTGELNWAKQIGNENTEKADDFISTDSYGNTYFSGRVTGEVDFDPNEGINYMVGNQGFSSPMIPFLSKMAPCAIYKGDTTTVHACDGYLWEETGEIYYETGIYSAIYPSISGCDSILFLNVDFESYGEDVYVYTCGTYTVPSGDETYMYSGSYIDTITNALGCDSIFTIHLTLYPAIDTTIIVAAISLTANLEGAVYQWVDCNADYAIIDGATNRSFVPLHPGEYAVIISKNGCMDTSACYSFLNASVNESVIEKINVYPNPTNGKFYLQLNQPETNFTITIRTVSGQIVYVQSNISNSTTLIDFKGENGIYLLELKTSTDQLYYTRFVFLDF